MTLIRFHRALSALNWCLRGQTGLDLGLDRPVFLDFIVRKKRSPDSSWMTRSVDFLGHLGAEKKHVFFFVSRSTVFINTTCYRISDFDGGTFDIIYDICYRYFCLHSTDLLRARFFLISYIRFTSNFVCVEGRLVAIKKKPFPINLVKLD